MVILGVDTSSTDLSVSLSVDGSIVSTVCRYVRNSHAEHITQAVKLALELGGVPAERVARIAVSVGPGSFTGLRIGLSFVKGLCVMTERKILPLSSLMVLAHAATSNNRNSKVNNRSQRRIFTAIDARQGRIHWGGFTWDDGRMSRLVDDRLSEPEELIDTLFPTDLLVVDTVGYSRSTVFEEFDGCAEIMRAESAALSRGASCVSLARDNRDDTLWQPAHTVVPQYMQMCAAQEQASLC